MDYVRLVSTQVPGEVEVLVCNIQCRYARSEKKEQDTWLDSKRGMGILLGNLKRTKSRKVPRVGGVWGQHPDYGAE